VNSLDDNECDNFHEDNSRRIRAYCLLLTFAGNLKTVINLLTIPFLLFMEEWKILYSKYM
jgi:hypothetical protein